MQRAIGSIRRYACQFIRVFARQGKSGSRRRIVPPIQLHLVQSMGRLRFDWGLVCICAFHSRRPIRRQALACHYRAMAATNKCEHRQEKAEEKAEEKVCCFSGSITCSPCCRPLMVRQCSWPRPSMACYTASLAKSATRFMARCKALSRPRRFMRKSICSALTITPSKKASTGARKAARVCRLAV